MKRNDRFYLYLKWPKYLAQWYAHEMYRMEHIDDDVLPPFVYDCDEEVRNMEPVKTRRGSAERNILEQCLTKQPDAVPELPDKDATICIEIPNFLNKPACTYNYLPRSARELLKCAVRTHFRTELIKYMNKVMFAGNRAPATQEKQVEAFMEVNGIEYNETSIIAIKQTWRRLYWKDYKMSKANENTRD